MAGGLKKIAGSKIYIGQRVPYKSKLTAADFTGQTWTEIGGWQQTGDLGAEQETVTQTLISQNTTIYSKGTISFPVMSNVFVPDASDAGQVAFAIAQKSCKPYAFRIDWGADCGEEGEVTFTYVSGEEGLVNWNAHGLDEDQPITFQTTGGLPGGIVIDTVYYVANPTANSFEVSATPGGSSIVFTGAGTGTHTALASDQGETDLLFGFAMYGSKTGGDASATRLMNAPIQPIAPAISI